MSLPVDLPPGIVKSTTANAAPGRWTDGDHVRFKTKRPEKIGGYVAVDVDLFDGRVRGALGWYTQGGTRIANMGTWRRLYKFHANTVTAITPLDSSGTLSNPFSTTDGSAIVTVAHSTHGRDNGSIVVFADASAVGGVTIDGEYIVTVVDADSYTITHSSAATSTAGPGGGATVAYEYEINPGSQSTTYGIGWGVGPWGGGTWGTPRSISSAIELDARYWHIQRYDSAILALPTGGTLYFWDQVSSDARAEAIANAPTARAFFLTAESFPVLLGTDDPMTMQWPNVDDITDWTPDASDNGNIRRLELGNKLIAGTAISDDMNIVWSDLAAYSMQYLGEGEIYRTLRLGDNIGLIGPGAFAVANEMVYWMSRTDLLMFSVGGGVRAIPNELDIRDWLYRNINRSHIGKSFANFNPKANSIQFGYCTIGNMEPNRYVELSLDDYSWSIGTMFGGDRTAMFFHPSPEGGVFMTDSDGALYEHETGHDADGAALVSFIKTGMIALGEGDADMDVLAVIPDFERQTGNVDMIISAYERPQSATVIDEQTISLAEGAEIEDFMVGGRHAQVEFLSNVIGGDFRLGVPRLTIQKAGSR